MIRKNFRRLLTTLILGSATLLQANDCECLPLEAPCPQLYFGVDFIYWKPCIDDLDFTAQYLPTTEGINSTLELKYKSICPSWNPGVRITAEIPAFCKGLQLAGSYTYVNVKEVRRVASRFQNTLSPLNIHPAIINFVGNTLFDDAKGSLNIRYQDANILLEYPYIFSGTQKVTPYVGVELMSLIEQQYSRYRTSVIILDERLETILESKWRSDYFGIGLTGGTEIQIELCEKLAFVANASASILTGDAETKCKQMLHVPSGFSTIDAFMYKDDDCCHIIPGYHIQCGLNYSSFDLGCAYSFRFGYEFVEWQNVSNIRRFTDIVQSPVTDPEPIDIDLSGGGAANSTQTNITDLGFHGLFVGLDLTF